MWWPPDKKYFLQWCHRGSVGLRTGQTNRRTDRNWSQVVSVFLLRFDGRVLVRSFLALSSRPCVASVIFEFYGYTHTSRVVFSVPMKAGLHCRFRSFACSVFWISINHSTVSSDCIGRPRTQYISDKLVNRRNNRRYKRDPESKTGVWVWVIM